MFKTIYWLFLYNDVPMPENVLCEILLDILYKTNWNNKGPLDVYNIQLYVFVRQKYPKKFIPFLTTLDTPY